MHLMDIAQNSAVAEAKQITIRVQEDRKADLLQLSVQDDGKGMDAETIKKVIDPFYTSRTTRKVGLGIPLLKEAAEACNGCLTIESILGSGTTVKIHFQRSHIDRMPLGDLAGTIFSLVIAYPAIHFIFEYSMDDEKFIYDDAPIKEELQGMSLTEPGVLSFIREYLEGGVEQVKLNAESVSQ